MKYVSTRGGNPVSGAYAVAHGLAPDGGLYMPESIPTLCKNDFIELVKFDYPTRAAKILSMYFDDFTFDELLSYTRAAYAPPKFPENAAPVVKIDGKTFILELFRGPTSAFKDMALQLLPYLLTASMKKLGDENTVCILVATSGDTGKAALEGFADVDGTKIIVFYPRDGVSAVQKLQMVTQSGKNVSVAAVEGNFDDAQSGVKKIFTDISVRETLKARGIELSSANSINWGRLAPQIVYYISAYCDMLSSGDAQYGDSVNVCVPTGNFGNILAAYFAREMGLPIGRFICASNSNNVLTDFINTGVYNRNRAFFTTTSPSMDILISSNVERLVYLLTGRNSEKTAEYMKNLAEDGRYQLSGDEFEAFSALFSAGWTNDTFTADAILEYYEKHSYLADTHTGVALRVLRDYRAASGDITKTIVASTASPYKFADAVLEALDGTTRENNVKLLSELSEKTGVPIPAPLASLGEKPQRFTDMVKKEDMLQAVYDFLK